jgi:hypothetical protein
VLARRRAAALPFALLLTVTIGPGAGATVIDAADAPAYVGSAVTVEGDVAVARSDLDGLVLELAPPGPKSVRIVLVRALFTSLPRAPERIYAGKRVRVTGLLRRFQGRPEMVLQSPSQIEIVDVAGAPPASAEAEDEPTTSPATTAAPETAVPSTVPPTATPAPPPPAVAVPAPRAHASEPAEPAPAPLLAERIAAERCARARTGWQEAAARARTAADALTRCLEVTPFACRRAAAALVPAVADLEWAEQQVADRCD